MGKRKIFFLKEPNIDKDLVVKDNDDNFYFIKSELFDNAGPSDQIELALLTEIEKENVIEFKIRIPLEIIKGYKHKYSSVLLT